MRNLLFILLFSLCSCESVKRGTPIFSKTDNLVFSVGKKTTIGFPSKTIKIATTAYCASEKDHLKFKRKSAIGTTLEEGKSIAADWSILPLGTVIRFAGNNYTVEDYGSALTKHERFNNLPIVDVYQPSKADMRDWGVRFFDNVQIIRWGSYEKSLEHLKNNLQFSHCRLMYKRILAKL